MGTAGSLGAESYEGYKGLTLFEREPTREREELKHEARETKDRCHSLHTPRMAVTITALFPGNNPVVVIFEDKKKSKNIVTQMCFFLSFNKNLILEVLAVKIHIRSS